MPAEKSRAVEGSGTVSGTTAMPYRPVNPAISEAFTVALEVVYSPIVPPPTIPPL